MGNKRSTGSIVAIVGGAALVIGAFLTWATISFDVHAFASLLGLDDAAVGQAINGALGDTSKSFTGLDAGSDGKWALAMGVVVIALAVLLIAWKQANKLIAIGILLAGLIGGGYAVYDITQVDNAKQDAIDQAAPAFQSLGVDSSSLGNVFDISLGVGIWVCALGGLVAIAGGVLVLTSEGQPDAAGAGAGQGMAMGAPMGASPPPASTPPPTSAPPPTPMSPPPAGPPAIATPQEPPIAPPGAPQDAPSPDAPSSGAPQAGSGDVEEASPSADGPDPAT